MIHHLVRGTLIMNVVLLMVLILEACLGICAWVSPEFLRSIASHLLTRADVIKAARAASRRRMHYWQGVLGLNQETTEEEISALAPMRPSGRQLAPESVRMRRA
jgi:hypothetical protein